MQHLYSTYEQQAGTRIALHSLDGKNEGYYHLDVQIRYTDVLMLMLEHETTGQVSGILWNI